jgi:hypothetical protein
VVTGASAGCGELDERVERCRRVHVDGLGLRHHGMATLLLKCVGDSVELYWVGWVGVVQLSVSSRSSSNDRACRSC